jgi:hypothetical protein
MSAGARWDLWSSRYVKDVGWLLPQLIETDDRGNVQFPQIVVDANGNALAVWSQSDGTRYSIWSNRYVAGTGWGTAELIETDDSGNAYSPQLGIDESGNAVAVWYQHDGTRYNIWANTRR